MFKQLFFLYISEKIKLQGISFIQHDVIFLRFFLNPWKKIKDKMNENMT